MLRILTAVSAIALASPALAQEAQPSMIPEGSVTGAEIPASDMPGSSTVNDPASSTPESAPDGIVEDMEVDNQIAEAAPTTEAAPTNSAEAVQNLVDQEFANYDADGSGDLDKTEFAAWMTKLRADTMAAQGQAGEVSSVEMEKWTETAFAAADSDQSSTVSKPEISDFLMG